MNQDLYENVTQIIDAMSDVKELLVHTLIDNNKAARKARRALVEIEKKAKVFRKLSVKHFKELKR